MCDNADHSALLVVRIDSISCFFNTKGHNFEYVFKNVVGRLFGFCDEKEVTNVSDIQDDVALCTSGNAA